MAKRVGLLGAIFGGDLFSTVVRLVIASVLVGILLSVLNVDPMALWRDFMGAASGAADGIAIASWDILVWAGRYLALGAIIVVPIWLAVRVFHAVFSISRED